MLLVKDAFEDHFQCEGGQIDRDPLKFWLFPLGVVGNILARGRNWEIQLDGEKFSTRRFHPDVPSALHAALLGGKLINFRETSPPSATLSSLSGNEKHPGILRGRLQAHNAERTAGDPFHSRAGRTMHLRETRPSARRK